MQDRRSTGSGVTGLSKRAIAKGRHKSGFEAFFDFLIAHSVPDSLWKTGAFTLVLVISITALFTLKTHFIHDGDLRADLEYAQAAFVVSLPFALFVSFGFLRMARMQSELARLAATDVLTGLANRRAFFEQAGTESETRGGVALVLDVDHFKRINDTYGHDVGDRCLKAVADLLRQMTRESDILGRLGGEEFAVFLVEAPQDKARAIGERLAEGIRLALDELEGQDVRVTVSVGAAGAPSTAPIGRLLAEADRRMYEAKRAGRARLVMSGEPDISAPTSVPAA
ncbi:diguanylate cyclase [Alphaproteobacteria bacterium GH1-50]|uniref:diguanylate cyclase n=1 Tax=Kangsaoukella pontilimi TaxID=2691042 RepID=A0A7C9IF18_9RHOB|nr:GGDEF domain-containing protein [Kangsaoukella pontilimi]MXQ06929.1 diguanylate cyclase [Kangsaoukella pontilimi]